MSTEYFLIIMGLLIEGYNKEGRASEGGWNILRGEKHEKRREKHQLIFGKGSLAWDA